MPAARGTTPAGKRRAAAAPAPRSTLRAMPRATRVLWAALLALALARFGLTFIQDMYGWGLNVQRFLAPQIAWPLWALIALSLVPALARRAVPAFAVAGDALVRGGAAGLLVAGAAAAGLVHAFPDEVRFVGDFLLRQGTVEERSPMGTLFPQALPLDLLLHYELPLRLLQSGIADSNTVARWIGALAAGLLAALAVEFARVTALRGIAALAAFAVVLFGGYLAMFTGYSKAFVELVVLFAATGVFGLRALRARDGGTAGAADLLVMGICVAVALVLHRTAPALLPALVLGWVGWWRGRGAAPLRDARVLLAAVVPAATLAVMAPRIAGTVLGIDAVHFTPPAVQAAGGPLQAAFAGTRLVDLLNMVALLSPLALAAPFVAAALGRAARERGLAFLVVLAAPCVLVWPFIHPVGGIARDWDDYSFGAVALSLIAARLVGEALRGREGGAAPDDRRAGDARTGRRGEPARPAQPAHAWLGVAVVAGVTVPAIQWIALHADLDAGLARARAFLNEAPRRPDGERARMLDYYGTITFQQDRWRESAQAMRAAAEIAPSPRLLQQWALAETRFGDFRTAQRAYWMLLEKDSLNASAWLGLATVSSRFGDIHESRRAALRTLELQPGQETAVALLRYLDTLPAGMVDSLTRLYPPRARAPAPRGDRVP